MKTTLSSFILLPFLVGVLLALDICENPSLTFPIRGTQNYFGFNNCTATARIPARTWMKLSTYSYVIWAQTYFPNCYQEYIYVELQRLPIQSKAYICGTGGIKPLLIGFHSEESEVEVKLHSAVIVTSYFTLSTLLARVIYPGENVIISEPAEQFDQIVSHDLYDQSQYGADINSTLRLTGFQMGGVIRVQLEEFSLPAGCSDYLQISGAVYENRLPITICDASTQIFYLDTTETSVSFNFVTDKSNNAGGFMIRYEQISPGCPADGVAMADIRYNTTLESFIAICKYGYHFSNTGETTGSTWCRQSDSTWSVTECTDIDECLIDNGGCSDLCNNTLGSYICYCTESEDILLQDGLTCAHPDTVGGMQGGKGSMTSGGIEKRMVYIVIGIIVPVVVIAVVLLVVFLILKRRSKIPFVKSLPPLSVVMSDVRVNLQQPVDDDSSPTYSVPMKRPPDQTVPIACPQRQRGVNAVGSEYDLAAPVYDVYYENSDQKPKIQQNSAQKDEEYYAYAEPVTTKQEPAAEGNVDLVDNELYGT